MFSFIPNCISYDPCFAYELAVIIHDGLKRMYEKQEDVFYYLTVMNENYEHPGLPQGCEKGIIKGMYLLHQSKIKSKHEVQLLGSGTILREVIAAKEMLEQDYHIAANIYSVTSFNELRKDMLSVIRHNHLNPEDKPKQSYVAECLAKVKGPVIAATDYLKLFAEQIGSEIQQPYYVLGTDGFGRSDTREALRDFFEVNANMIVYTALKALYDQGNLPKKELLQAMKKLNIDSKRPDPVTV